MNWKTTLLLLALALLAGLWLWKGDDWSPRLGLQPTAAPAESQSLAALTENITSEKLARIEVPSETGPSYILEKADAERVKVAAAAPPPSPFGPPSVGQGVATATLLGDKVNQIEVRGPGRPLVLFGASIARPEAYTLRKTGPFPPAVVTEKGGEPAV